MAKAIFISLLTIMLFAAGCSFNQQSEQTPTKTQETKEVKEVTDKTPDTKKVEAQRKKTGQIINITSIEDLLPNEQGFRNYYQSKFNYEKFNSTEDCISELYLLNDYNNSIVNCGYIITDSKGSKYTLAFFVMIINMRDEDSAIRLFSEAPVEFSTVGINEVNKLNIGDEDILNANGRTAIVPMGQLIFRKSNIVVITNYVADSTDESKIEKYREALKTIAKEIDGAL